MQRINRKMLNIRVVESRYLCRKQIGCWVAIGRGTPLVLVLACALLLGEVAAAEKDESPSGRTQEPAPQADSSPKEAPQTGMLPRARSQKQRQVRHARAKRQRDAWWQNAHTVLFSGIELSPEQRLQVDEIIDLQKQNRTRFGELDLQLSISQSKRQAQHSKEIREQIRGVQNQLKPAHELFEEMRLVLLEEQRPTFDVNRARLVAEGGQSVQEVVQKPGKRRRVRRPKDGNQKDSKPESEDKAAKEPSEQPVEQRGQSDSEPGGGSGSGGSGEEASTVSSRQSSAASEVDDSGG